MSEAERSSHLPLVEDLDDLRTALVQSSLSPHPPLGPVLLESVGFQSGANNRHAEKIRPRSVDRSLEVDVYPVTVY